MITDVDVGPVTDGTSRTTNLAHFLATFLAADDRSTAKTCSLVTELDSKPIRIPEKLSTKLTCVQ